jgi:Na+/melibiose symporter-like transporter
LDADVMMRIAGEFLAFFMTAMRGVWAIFTGLLFFP